MCQGLLPTAPNPARFDGTPNFTNSRYRVVPRFQRFQIICLSLRQAAELLSEQFQAPVSYSTVQIDSDQFQHSFVFDHPCHPRHEHVVVHPVKEFLQVYIYYPHSLLAHTSAPALSLDAHSVQVDIRNWLVKTAALVPVRSLVGVNDLLLSISLTASPLRLALISLPASPGLAYSFAGLAFP